MANSLEVKFHLHEHSLSQTADTTFCFTQQVSKKAKQMGVK